jgi:hypothetical protein
MNPQFLKTSKYREQQGRAFREGAFPEIVVFEKAFIRELKKRGMPFFAHNMVRTFAEQDGLYVRGVTKARAGQSPHNYGLAVDIIHSNYAWDVFNDPSSCEIVGHLGKEVAQRVGVNIEWGGDWGWDPAHWEITGWKILKDQYPSWERYWLKD